MRVTGEMKERYGRDENDLSHAEPPFYKGDSEDNGRDERIFIEKLKKLKKLYEYGRKRIESERHSSAATNNTAAIDLQ